MQIEWIIAGLSAVCVVFFFLSKKNMPNMAKASYKREDNEVKDFRRELEMVAELTVRKIEEKISRLDYLIEEAQEKSNQLDDKLKLVNIALEQIKNEKTGFSSLAQKQSDTGIKKTAQPWSMKKPAQFRDIGFTETIKQKRNSSVFASGGVNSSAADKDILNNEKHRVALTMLQEGYNILDIAKVTGLGKGEIMLLQGLRDRANIHSR